MHLLCSQYMLPRHHLQEDMLGGVGWYTHPEHAYVVLCRM